MAMVNEPLYLIAVLIHELKNEDIQLRLNSIRRLSTISRFVGEDRTRQELIPFLSETNDDDDEVLLAMTEELEVFIPYVGGVEYAHVLLPSLETLCTIEETCVRDKSVESLCRIGAQMKRLTGGEWFTTCVSSCGLFHIAYPSAPEMLKTEPGSIYSQLCQDDTPMVRRSAASNLGKFAAIVEQTHLKSDIMSIFNDLTHDDQDSVRLLAVEGSLLQYLLLVCRSKRLWLQMVFCAFRLYFISRTFKGCTVMWIIFPAKVSEVTLSACCCHLCTELLQVMQGKSSCKRTEDQY